MMRRIIKIFDKFYTKSFGFLNLGIIGLLFSILTSDIIDFKYKEILIKALLAVIGIPLVFMMIVKSYKLFFFYLKCYFNSLLGLKCEYTCLFIGDKGDMETQVYYKIKNVSFSPQRIFLADSEGFRENIEFKPSYFLINRSQHLNASKIRIIGTEEKISLSKYDDYSENINVHQAIWSTTIDPPLISGEEIEVVRYSVDKELEKIAFTEMGTVFIFRCISPYKAFTMNIVAPSGFIFESVSNEVDNQNGKKVSLTEVISRFNISGNKNIKWVIPFPDISLRYKIKFKLVEI